MGKVYEAIDEKLGAWIERQHLFFVATAPLAADGHVNMSPKGDLRWFRILGPREVGHRLGVTLLLAVRFLCDALSYSRRPSGVTVS